MESGPVPQNPARAKTGSKATVEIFNKLIREVKRTSQTDEAELEHDVGGLRSEVLHIRDNIHDLKTSLRAMPTREEMREELREIRELSRPPELMTVTSTLQETTASLSTALSASLTSSIAESIKQMIGDHVAEAVEKATRNSAQSLPAITAHLVCEKTKVALGSTEKNLEATMRSTLKSVQPHPLAPPGGMVSHRMQKALTAGGEPAPPDQRDEDRF